MLRRVEADVDDAFEHAVHDVYDGVDDRVL
jgi:hypothetical protein